jgi:hypothetical protein
MQWAIISCKMLISTCNTCFEKLPTTARNQTRPADFRILTLSRPDFRLSPLIRFRPASGKSSSYEFKFELQRLFCQANVGFSLPRRLKGRDDWPQSSAVHERIPETRADMRGRISLPKPHALQPGRDDWPQSSAVHKRKGQGACE